MRVTKVKLIKRQEQIKNILRLEIQKQKIEITMIYISFQKFLTKGWPEQHQSQLLWRNQMFHQGI